MTPIRRTAAAASDLAASATAMSAQAEPDTGGDGTLSGKKLTAAIESGRHSR